VFRTSVTFLLTKHMWASPHLLIKTGQLIEIMPEVEFDKDIEEWRIKIRNMTFVISFSVITNPPTRCPTCTNHYCNEHYKTHFHLTKDSDPEYYSLTDDFNVGCQIQITTF